MIPLLAGVVLTSPAGAIAPAADLSAPAAASDASQRTPGDSPFTPAAQPAAVNPPTLGKPEVVVDPTGALELTSVVSRISSTVGSTGPIRAGDVLQYHVAVKNLSSEAWTKQNPLAFSTDLTQLLDDSVLVSGVRQGTRAGNGCGPTGWDGNSCKAVESLVGGVAKHTFALAPQATHFFNYRVQIDNDYLTGDLRLVNAAMVQGAAHGAGPTVAAQVAFSDDVTVLHPQAQIANSVVSVVAGGTARTLQPGETARAGETLQYHVAVENPLEADGVGADWTAAAANNWTQDKRLTFTTDLSGLLDDTVLVSGVRQGTRAGSGCGPTGWDGNSCKAVDSLVGDVATHTFALKAGATHYFNYRVKVTNDFTVGDQQLLNEAVITGDPGNGQPLIEKRAQVENAVEVLHPDVTIAQSVATVLTRGAERELQPGDAVRAGEEIQYHVAVENPAGGGDWTAPTSDGAASDKRLTFATDLSDLLDDTVLVSGVRQGTVAGNYCGPTAWDGNYCKPVDSVVGGVATHTFALKAGKTHYFNYRVRVTNDFVAGDNLLINEAIVTGEPGNGQPGVEGRTSFSNKVAELHPDVTIAHSVATVLTRGAERELQQGDNVRAGEEIQYHVAVENPAGGGDWTAPTADGMASDRRLTFTTDLSRMLDDAVLVSGVRQGTIAGNYCGPTAWDGNYCKPVDSVVGGVATHTFALNAGKTHYFNYRVRVTNDFTVGDQRLLSESVVAGDPGNGQAPVEVRTSFDNTVSVLHPGLEISDPTVTKIKGDVNGPVRAGDQLQYDVTVSNPVGGGDWTVAAGNGWASDKRATFTTDLSGLGGHAVLIGDVRQGTTGGRYCGPGGWNQNYCKPVDKLENSVASHTFALDAGKSHFFSYRVEVGNDYPSGATLQNEACASGEPGNGQPTIRVCGDVSTELELQHPALEIEKSVANITNPKAATARPGDVLEYTVTVKNPGKGDWNDKTNAMAANLVSFSDDLSDVLDDAAWKTGSPDGCFTYGCAAFEPPVDGQLTHEFALKAGATKTMKYQVTVSDRYTGDESLVNEACVSGDTGGPAGIVHECDSITSAMVQVYPELEAELSWTKSPRPNDPLRAGDRVAYTITLHNPGEGDWNVASAWAAGNPVTLTKDLTDILDDSVLVGKPSVGATIENGVLSWTGGLAAGKSRSITFSVTVKNVADGIATDLWLNGTACAAGDSRNPALPASTITVCPALELPIGEKWQMSKKLFNDQGAELNDIASVRSGQELTYVVSAWAVGGWPVPDVQLTDDVSRVLHLAQLQGDVMLQVGNGPKTKLEVIDGKIVTPRFELPGTGQATITYTVKIPDDVHTGTLLNQATGMALPGSGAATLPDRCGTNLRPCETEHRIVGPRPTISKTQSVGSTVTRGDNITYKVRVTNPGPGSWTATNPISVIDDLARVLDDATLVNDVMLTRTGDAIGVIVPVTDGEISWQGALAAGEWLELTYTVNVNIDRGGGDRYLVNEACTGTPGAERYCDDTYTSIPLDPAEIEKPVWGPDGEGCVAPPWINLPVTPGIVYTISGDVVPGGSVTVTATPQPGYELVVPKDWTLAADGQSASFTIHFATCDTKKFAEPEVKYTTGVCSPDGNHTPPTLELVETEGIDYSYVGEVKAGSTVVVTATAQDGYWLRNSSMGRHWSISKDGKTATLTINFPELNCPPTEPGEPLISPERPVWSGPTCDAPNREPEFRLPVTPGLTYTYTGTAAVGSSIVITVTADDGRKLGRVGAHGWVFATDGLSATFTITFYPPRDCGGGSGAGAGSTSNGNADGEIPPIEGGAGAGATGTSNADGIDPDPLPGDIEIAPLPGLPEPECVAGVVTMPDLTVIMVPGVWYDVQGKMEPGETVVLTAHTLPGYILQDTADWMKGDWVLAPDRKSATRTVTFPSFEDLCGLPGEKPEQPGEPGEPEVPEVPEKPEVPETPEGPEVPEGPETPTGGPQAGAAAAGSADAGAEGGPEGSSSDRTPPAANALTNTGGASGAVAASVGAFMLLLGGAAVALARLRAVRRTR
ncbi:DUF7927 domain-containing protein [Leucobacter sp. HY1908]